MGRLVWMAPLIVAAGCTADPYTREQKVSETVQQGGIAAAQCGGLSFVSNLLGGRSGGDSVAEAGKAAVVCGVAGAVVGAQLDAYEQQLLNELQVAGVKMNVQQDARILEMEEPILFSRADARLSSTSANRLIAVGKIFQKFNQRQVDIIGHSASDEADEVALARAKVVTSRLKEMTGGRLPLRMRSKGSSEPVGDNRTETGRDRNRRVTIFVALHASS
ncbi:OmpA family protein [Rhodopseudomonas palustris]|uniref:OmpA/MotB n=1 Tax=Rhodopseudomonas palustris (strain BisB18) TaxID=316056 RepID=Q213L2_RHOPB